MKNREDRTLALAEALDPARHGKQVIPFDSRLIDQAVREGVAGILYKSLLASGRFESLDQVHRQSLQAFYYQTVRMNLRLMRALKQVLSQANQRKISLIVLQGMDLLNEPYEDIGLRPMTDVDLRVSKEDFPVLVQILESLGYKRDAVYPGSFKQGLVLIDVHTHLLWADRIRTRELLLGKSEDHLIKEARAIEIEGERALCLSSYDQVLYLSLHAFKHRVDRLIWLVDIKRILERWNAADWDRFVHRAQELGQKKTLMYIFYLLEQVFRFRTPQDALKLLQGKRLNPLEKEILRRRKKKGSLPPWGPVLLFSSELGPGKRLAFFFENLFPRAEVLRQVFPSPPNLKPWQLYGKRALQLLGMLRRSVERRAESREQES